jgi:hypothetical protein
MSKEIGRFTCDVNAGYQLIGQPGTSGHDQNSVFIFTLQRALIPRLSIVGEVGGQTRLGDQELGFVTTLWALTYRVHPQVVLDAGIDVGISDGAPRKRILFGMTYAIADLYRGKVR